MGKVKTELDQEWVRLISEAKEVGMSLGEVKAFFQSASNKASNAENPVIKIGSQFVTQIVQTEDEKLRTIK